jgi:hypothetical protein
MNDHDRLGKLLLAMCALSLMLLGVIVFGPAVAGGPTGTIASSGRAAGGGLAPFIAPGGSIATACDGVDTCTTGAITNVETGDTLVVVVTEYTTSAGAPSSIEEVTHGGNNALTLLGSTPCIAGSGHGVTAIFGLADVQAQASVTFTVTYHAAEYYTIHALDVQGAAASPFETAGAGVCSTAAGGTATATATTTVANDLVILGAEVRASTAIAATGGDALVTDASTTGAELDSGAMLDESDVSTGSISLSATFTSASWSAIAVGLKPSFPLTAGVVSPSTASIDAGQSIELTTTAATGGTSPIAYQWYNATSSAACSSGTLIGGATGQSFTTPALLAGTDQYCVWATDSSLPTSQVAYSNVATITVDPALTVSITPAASSIDEGQNVSLTAHPSGGTGADTYAWYAGSSCSGPVVSTAHVYTSPALIARTSYCAAATDSAYSPSTATATATVTVSASPLAVSITPSAPSVASGKMVQLTAHASGGTGADSYAWYSGATCSGPVLATSQVYTTSALTAIATYCVAATDSAFTPVTATAHAMVTVTTASSSSSTLPPYLYAAIGGVLAVLAALLLLAFLARRGRKVTFTETGLPTNTEWSLTFAGMIQKSTGSSITFNAKRGKHGYVVQKLAGYAANPPAGTLEMGKDPPELRITFTAQSP